MVEVVIDTNALIYAAKQKIDIYELLAMQGYTPTVPACVFVELRQLCKNAKKGTDRAAAELASQIVEKKLKVVDIGKGHADDLILKYATAHKARVLTNDREFKKKLKASGVVAVSISKSKQIR